MHNQVLENVSSAKYLGVKITDDLEWDQHINEITSNATKTLGFLRRNLTFAPKETKAAAFKTLVRPKLEYAAPVWMPYHQVDINRIEKVQRTAAMAQPKSYRRNIRRTPMARPAGKTTAGSSVSVLENSL